MATVLFIFWGLKFWQIKPPFWIYDWGLVNKATQVKSEVNSLNDLIDNLAYYILNEDYDRALSSLNSYLYNVENPGDSLFFLKAEVFYYTRDLDSSLMYLRRLQRAGDSYFKNMSELDRAWIYIEKREYPGALHLLGNISKLSEYKWVCYAYYTYGLFYIKRHEPESSLIYLKDKWGSKCDSLSLHFSLLRKFLIGKAYMDMEMTDSASNYLTELLEGYPSEDIALYSAYYWGNYLFGVGLSSQAIYYLNFLISYEERALKAGIPMYYVKRAIAQAKYNQAIETDYESNRIILKDRRKLKEALKLYKELLLEAATPEDSMDARLGIRDCYKVLIENTVDITDLEVMVDSMINYIPGDSLIADGFFRLANKYEILAQSYEKEGFVTERAREFYEKSLNYYQLFIANFPQHRLTIDAQIEVLLINAKLERWDEVLRVGELLLVTLPEYKEDRRPEIIYLLGEGYYLRGKEEHNREKLRKSCNYLRRFKTEYCDHPLAPQALEILRKCENALR